MMAPFLVAAVLLLVPVVCPLLADAALCVPVVASIPIAVVGLAQTAMVEVQGRR